MVFIKSITCHGFKSFRYNTRVNFSRGFSAIVGANGSGKSNIIDALVFVLGNLSAKTMRARTMRDIISNGGTKKDSKPAPHAFVKIEFDNQDRQIPVDADTVTISRKVNRKGRGTYKINGNRTSRREILDLLDLANLKPTSTNVIMQGELFRLINQNPDERRELIEDIAGIATYDEKKAQAREELAETEQNISQITLLLNEVSTQMDQLARERDDALEFQRLTREVQLCQRALVEKQVSELKAQLATLDGKKEAVTGQIQQVEAERRALRETISAKSLELDHLTKQLRELESGEVRALSRRISALRDALTRYRENRKSLKKEISGHARKQEKLQQTLENLQAERAELETTRSELHQKREKVRAQLETTREELATVNAQLAEKSTAFMEKKAALETLLEEISGVKAAHAKAFSELTALNREIKRDHAQQDKLARRLTRARQDVEKWTEALARLQDTGQTSDSVKVQAEITRLEREIKKIQGSLPQLREQIDEKREQLIKLKSKMKYARRSARNSKAIAKIIELGQQGEIEGIHGTIQQLGTASVKYDTALQVAGGGRFNYVVVDDREVARQCIQYLKKHKLGRVSFIPLREIRVTPNRVNVPLTDKVIGRAVDLIQFDPFYEKAFEFVFGYSLVVADLPTATRLDVPLRKITLDGDVVERSNLMTGGTFKKAAGVGFSSVEAQRLPVLEQEIQALKVEEGARARQVKTLQKSISDLYREKIKAERGAAEAKARLRGLQEKITDKQAEIHELETEIHDAAALVQEKTERLPALQTRVDSLETRLTELNAARTRLREELETSEESSLQEQLRALETTERDLTETARRLELEATKVDTRLSDFVETRLLQISQEIDAERASEANAKADLEKLATTVAETKEELAAKQDDLEQRNAEISGVVQAKNAKQDEIAGIKLQIGQLSQKLHPLALEVKTCELKAEEVAREIQKLQVREFPDTPLDPEYVQKSVDALSALIREDETRRTRLEPVNMRAIQAYDDCLTRFNDLQDKHVRVVEEREAILQFMDDIEREKKRVFLDAFTNINRNFALIFKKLSPDGEAKLELENEEDPFAGGINMLARPGGKKWCLTQAMSGGEKTLTVIALVLGIQMHVPSPYYVLDEIDAALDDANAAIVAELIQELSNRSQFILITHRDVTMARVQQLLGVTNQNGITSVVNMNIQEVLAQLAQ